MPDTSAEPDDAQPDDPAPATDASSEPTVTVATAWPVSLFHHAVEGIESITAAGVQVPERLLADIHAAAGTAGTTLKEIR